VFPVMYELNSSILFGRNSFLKGLLIFIELNSRLTENAMCLHYKDQPANAVQGNNHCVL
jgi:hypothetical protein